MSIQINLSEELEQKFKAFCDRNGYSYTGRIRVLIRRDLLRERHERELRRQAQSESRVKL